MRAFRLPMPLTIGLSIALALTLAGVGPSRATSGLVLPSVSTSLKTSSSHPIGLFPGFIEDRGQYSTEARFVLSSPGTTLWLAEDVLWLTLRAPSPSRDTAGAHIKISFPGAGAPANLTPFNPQSTRVSSFKGDAQSSWQAGAPAWGGVRYADLYPGIDLELTAGGAGWSWRFVARSNRFGHEPPIVLRVEGADGVTLVDGQLVLATAAGRYDLPLPASDLPFQVSAPGDHGESQPFHIPPRDASAPARSAASRRAPADAADLQYATYLGGGNSESGNAIAVDATGHAYITGSTWSTDFPTTPGAFDTDHANNNWNDVFVAKLNATGSALVYATFLGGSSKDVGNGIAVDADGAAYVTGYTCSDDFATTQGAFDRTVEECDAFVVKLNPLGSRLEYATLLGGSRHDQGNDIAIDLDGYAHVGGWTNSDDLPATVGDSSLGGDWDGFVARLNPQGSGLYYARYLGGSGDDQVHGLALDGSSSAYVVGSTYSDDFPTTPGAYDVEYNGGHDLFVAKVPSHGGNLSYATYLGGSSSECWTDCDIAVDQNLRAYVTGDTYSTDFPTTAGAYDTLCGETGDCSPVIGNTFADAFVTALTSDGGNLIYSTYLGGALPAFADQGNYDYVHAIAVSPNGQATVVGTTNCSDYPATPGSYDPDFTWMNNAFLTRVSVGGDTLDYSTFFGSESGFNAIALDLAGAVYLAGGTPVGDNIPTTPGAYDRTPNGGDDAFAAKFFNYHYILGRVTDHNEKPISDVLVYYGSGNAVVSDGNGQYIIDRLGPDSYNLAPSKTGYAFSPVTRTISIPPYAAGQDFTVLATPVTATLTPGVPGTVAYSDVQGILTRLTFPVDAVSQPTEVVLTPVLAANHTGLLFAGHAFEVELFQGGVPVGYEDEVTVEVHYSDADARRVSDESRLALYLWLGETWLDAAETCSPASTYYRDTHNNILSVTVCHLSRYGLFGPDWSVYLPLVVRE